MSIVGHLLGICCFSGCFWFRLKLIFCLRFMGSVFNFIPLGSVFHRFRPRFRPRFGFRMVHSRFVDVGVDLPEILHPGNRILGRSLKHPGKSSRPLTCNHVYDSNPLLIMLSSPLRYCQLSKVKLPNKLLLKFKLDDHNRLFCVTNHYFNHQCSNVNGKSLNVLCSKSSVELFLNKKLFSLLSKSAKLGDSDSAIISSIENQLVDDICYEYSKFIQQSKSNTLNALNHSNIPVKFSFDPSDDYFNYIDGKFIFTINKRHFSDQQIEKFHILSNTLDNVHSNKLFINLYRFKLWLDLKPLKYSFGVI